MPLGQGRELQGDSPGLNLEVGPHSRVSPNLGPLEPETLGSAASPHIDQSSGSGDRGPGSGPNAYWPNPSKSLPLGDLQFFHL